MVRASFVCTMAKMRLQGEINLLTSSETHSQSTEVEIGSTGFDIEATIGVESGKTGSTCIRSIRAEARS